MIGLLLASVACAANVRSLASSMAQLQLGAHDDAHTKSLVQKLNFQHRLRVCNAYPYGAALDVYRAKEKLTEEPMKYKNCRQFNIQLLMGDKLQFKVGDQNVGTFAVASMPENDAILLLVISRHDTLSTAVSFESHIFANLLNAQLAVIDTYKGESKSSLRITDVGDDEDKNRSEDLRFDSVVAINPGEYNCALFGKDGVRKKMQPLHAQNREAYVVLRIGVDAQKGSSYPEDIIVFPDHPLGSGAASCSLAFLLALVLFWN